ncbi:MAG: RNA polymerase subunit sigma-24 [Deltaproteobacteria bacterium]|jgi:RNA polymerase sigma-70 factor (ECF subfamily)|nr:RNA polymerase subunit sigma-24 [Deltaproteobacteria bacterium]
MAEAWLFLQAPIVVSTSPDDGSLAPEALAALLRRVQLGDADALAELHGHFRGDLDRLCRRLLGDPSEAEEARSEAFLRARESLASYDAGRPFRSWLLAVAANLCIDRLRRRALEGRLFRSSDLDASELPARGPSPLQALLGQARREELSRALDALDARYRAPLVLRFYAELSYREIADTLAIRPEQVGVLLHRAKAKLRSRLSGLGPLS